MPFDFLKKKGPETNKAKDAEPSKSATKPKGEGFESQSEALKPKDEKGKKGGLAGALASIRENVDKSSIGKAFGTPGWYKNQWQGVEDAVKMNSFKHTMAHYREAFRAFCAQETSLENLDSYEAITEGRLDGGAASPQVIYQTFFLTTSDREVNITQAVLKELHAHASKGEFAKMDFSKLVVPIERNLTDTWSRFKDSDLFKKWLFHKMTGVKSPSKVGGVKGE
ncbi:MAG TPA: hypothetical protein PK095_09955 [Myxococcota bacterium]|nr:hypothetical protein [Myxococcota bacterium]